MTFVLPRLRTFAGFPLPPAGQPDGSAAAQSGVVSLGMTPEAMSLWPATEINWDSYPGKAVGFQVSRLCTQTRLARDADVCTLRRSIALPTRVDPVLRSVRACCSAV